jgi:hypothetical protein
MKKLLFFILPFFCLAAFADSMSVFVNGNLTALKPSATNAVLITAKNYTDTQIQAIPAAHDFGPDIATASNAVLTASKTYADTKLPKSGGTMTGAINMGSKKITSLAAPTSDADASTKKYVDDAKAAAISTAASDAESKANAAEQAAMSGAALDATTKANAALANAKNYSDTNTLVRAKSYADSAASTAASGKVSKSGDTMSGALNMGSKKITNLATPTSNADASTKKYVDDAAASAVSTAASDATTKANTAESNAKTWGRGATNAVLTAAKTYASSVASTAESNAKTYADGVGSSTLNSAKTWGRGATNAVLATAKTYAASQASTAESNAKSYADTKKSEAISSASSDATTKVNAAKLQGYTFAENLKIKMGTGADAPKAANNSTAYTLATGREKIALTNTVAGTSLALFVDVISPEATPVTATVQAGNARYCTVNFPISDVLRGKTVSFHLLVTCVNTADSVSPACVKDFYITHTFTDL